MMDLTAILDDLHRLLPFFPDAALRAAAERREEVTPVLLQLLADAVERASNPGEHDQDMAWMYALFLLAQFREPRAYPLLVQLASLPSEVADAMLGDSLTEDLDVLLASVSNGDPGGIQSLAENNSANLFARTAALRALVILVKIGEQKREDVLDYFGSLFRGKLKREPSFLWGSLVSDALDLYPDTIRDEVEQALAEGLDCERVCGQESVEQTFRKGRQRVLAELERNERYQLLSDAVSRMEWWACFNSDERPDKAHQPRDPGRNVEPLAVGQPYRRETAKVGRNDPCPCGSGKKFKRCCG